MYVCETCTTATLFKRHIAFFVRSEEAGSEGEPAFANRAKFLVISGADFDADV